MKILTASSANTDVNAAVDEIFSKLMADEDPNLVIFSCTVGYDVEMVYELVHSRLGDIPFQGGTSFSHVMTDEGLIGSDGVAMAAIAFWSEDLEFGIGSCDIATDARNAASSALEQAIDNAERSGELPSAVWLVGAPGQEEKMIEGLAEAVGNDMPLIGGSSSDNTIEGHWYQFTNEGLYTNHVTVVALFQDDNLMVSSFHNGYDPTEQKGTITKAENRTVYEIDNKPAAEVYNEWTKNALAEEIAQPEGASIVHIGNAFPIGREVGEIAGVKYHQLSYPSQITPDKGVHVFTDLSVGEEILCMQGSADNLIQRSGNVIKACIDKEELKQDEIIGALVIICAGSLMAVGPRMAEACENIKQTLGPDVPFFSMFTFGEQGSLAGGENRHGNLMNSVLLFTNREI